MIIKGKARGGPISLAAHLGNRETNEVVSLLEIKDLLSEDLQSALVEMYSMADGTNITRPLYHAAISPEMPNRLTDEQRTEAIEALEQKMGFEGTSRVVILHEKEGREHIHVVWSRVDPETQLSISDSLNYKRHEEVARDLERRFGHDRIQGAFAEREGVDRPDRTPSRAELRQEERTGIKGKDVKSEVTELYNASDGPEAFRAALSEKGYSLAKGDRRDYVIIDRVGGIHSLARRIGGVNAEGLREFMGPLTKEDIPNIEEARQLLKDHKQNRKFYIENGFTDKEISLLESTYAHGADYVSQSMAALKEHHMRQTKLDNQFYEKYMPNEEEQGQEATQDKNNEEFDEKRRKEESEGEMSTDVPSSQEQVYTKSSATDGIEMTDEQSSRMERLMNTVDKYIQSHENGQGRSGGRGGRKRER